jgi:carbon-monoxide dehydrogenase medium subunit
VIQPFVLHQPDSLEEACLLRAHYREDAKLLAGGSELIILLKLGLARPNHIINLKAIPKLDVCDFDHSTQTLTIGTLVTHRQLESSSAVLSHFHLIAQMEHKLANVRVRNVGTLGGNLCFAEPHADPPALLSAYNAHIRARSPKRERILHIREFFVDYYKTGLEEDEILTSIEVPKLDENFAGTYYRFCPGERPIVTLALLINWNETQVEDVRLALGCVGPTPIRALQLERDLIGRTAKDISLDAPDLGRSAALLCDPLEDTWGSKEYKRQIVKTLVMRAFAELCQKRISG